MSVFLDRLCKIRILAEKFVAMNLKKLFHLQTAEQKVSEYRELLRRSEKIEARTEELANEFAERSQVLKSFSLLDKDEREISEEKYNEFLKEHTSRVAQLQKDRDKVFKSIAAFQKDEDIAEAIADVYAVHVAKKAWKSKKLSKSAYDDIMKAKTGVVKYADVLLFRGGKLLILQRAGEHMNYTPDWCIPGGHVDEGEDFRTAAQRELFEETGIDVPEDTLMEVGVAKTKNAEIHYFMGHVDDESPAFVVVDGEEEIGSMWIDPDTELEDYDFIFDMKDNIKKILGLGVQPSPVEIVMKAFQEKKVTEDVVKSVCEKYPKEIRKANNKTDFSHSERKDLAKKGEAMPNGKYPIRNSQDLKDAIKLSGASDMPKEKVKAWIKKRAKELGLESELPEDWKSKEVEKTMDCNDANAICKEDLDDKPKGPEGDGIAKNEETETTESEETDSQGIWKSEDGLTVSMKFSSVEDAMIFKSVISEMIQEGKVKADVLEKAKKEDRMYTVFADFANFLEGVKTRSKNVHWKEEDNAKHKYLDDLLEELSDYEDKIMEAGQSGFGRFKDGEINGEEIEVNDPIELVDLIIDRTREFYSKLDNNPEYAGEKSWVEDFMATLKQTKYRLQLH
jgi:8-oxo-dGTP pyrophosphatase MutT (NUDIX family)|nr:MAG TPA: NUDIX hydrolase [Bacteriophage sp.]